MTRAEIMDKLTAVFRDVFDDDSIVLADSTTASDIEDWDSLMHITLISSIENEFDLKFDMKTIVSMKNVGDVVDIIEKSL